MISENDLVSFMSRHFVALACEYESLNADGTVCYSGTTVYSGFLMELGNRVVWITAGHCLKGELDENIAKGVLRVTGGGFIDYFGHEARHVHCIPFTYEPGCAFYVENSELGLDFAILDLGALLLRAFEANKLVPISIENWDCASQQCFDFYRMLGIPKDRVFTGKTADQVQVQQAMVAVNKLSQDEIGEPPFGLSIPSEYWFAGRLDSGADIKDIKGMSGGPIYGFRRDISGRLTYHVVALQSRWWDTSRTIFGCSVPYFVRVADAFKQL